ncbi:DUF3748 domain-containing protein [Spirosoma foliorum]|uniref:DUF3748 domain-containing protein n=1 Tax=Spirosoma foliorum TaxID=2710596 RepID=A0A7G5H0S3_9BACT|nr:DUF3748 domain-containing protein [Spirosoma foliorum]QMW04715.1 DUF3748 domain-containing protein [Spirosoma foliorum]
MSPLQHLIPGWLAFLGLWLTGEQPTMPIETQLTFEAKGHTINNNQAFSPDDRWIVYDTRNIDTGLGQNSSVELVDVNTKEIRQLYQTTNQTQYGPGAGAVAFSPKESKVVFLHGLRNADARHPYSMSRRTGVLVAVDQPQKPHFLDGRCLNAPFVQGALRGGTHAHQWSADGQRISFTYNDEVMERLSQTNPAVKDLRTVGILTPSHSVKVHDSNDADCFDGEWFATVIARVTEQPRQGSDEIEKAFDETWIGTNGYRKDDGSWQKRAIAFQGNVRNQENQLVTEVFVVDLPEDLTQANPGQPLEGTATTRPNPPAGVTQHRITFTKHGIEGPRHWLRTLPDGSLIGFLAKDDAGLVQLFGVSPNGGPIRQLTHQPFAIQTTFNFSPDGKKIAYAADNSIFVSDVATGEFRRLTPRSTDEQRPVNGVVWSNKGDRIAYNRYVSTDTGRYVQLFQLTGF